MKAMILAAGLGTRLKPFTNHHPKALAVVKGKSLLQRNIEYLQQFNIKNVVVNVHHFANQIIDAIQENNGWGSTIEISNETDAVLETGGGLIKASPLFANEDNMVLMNADILTNLNLANIINFHKTHNPLATLAVTNRNSSRCFLFNENQQLQGWKNLQTNDEKGPVVHMEQNAKQQLKAKAFSGIHVINTQLFKYVEQRGKFSMVDVYLSLCSNHNILAFDHSNDVLIDVGKPESIEKAEQIFK